MLVQNGHVERLIGSIRREYLDHPIVSGEAYLGPDSQTYADYYSHLRTCVSRITDFGGKSAVRHTQATFPKLRA